MIWRSSSLRIRSKIADGAIPSRRAISALAMRASRCRKATICRSVSSSVRPAPVTGTSSVSREWLMAEGISALGPIIKNIRRSLQTYDERSTIRPRPFKHHHSHRHPTPGMLTDLDEPETLIAAMPSPPPDRDAERALVDRARGGDVGAFEALYRTNVARVFALALRLTGDHRDATELTQDVFVQAWQRLATFRGDA